MQNLLNLAVEAALDAGRQIMEIYASGDFNVELKGDDSPLTRADVASHRAIMAHLESTGIPVLSEEGRLIPHTERAAWSRLWIVDPIDGTKEFIKRNGEFTVNIALVEEGIPTMGVVFVPAKQELFVGVSEGENASPHERSEERTAGLPTLGFGKASQFLPAPKTVPSPWSQAEATCRRKPPITSISSKRSTGMWRPFQRKLLEAVHGRCRRSRLLPPFCADHGMGHRGRARGVLSSWL